MCTHMFCPEKDAARINPKSTKKDWGFGSGSGASGLRLEDPQPQTFNPRLETQILISLSRGQFTWGVGIPS